MKHAQEIAEEKNVVIPALQKEFEAALKRGVILRLPESAVWSNDRKQLVS